MFLARHTAGRRQVKIHFEIKSKLTTMFYASLPAGSKRVGSPDCLYGLNLGLGATTGANFLGACCWEMEMLALPKDGIVSILAVT